MNGPVPTRRWSRTGGAVLGFVAIVAAGLALYGMGRPGSKTAGFGGACPLSEAAARRADPFVHGEVAALSLATRDNPLRAVAFDGPDGSRLTLDAFKGRTVLLNLWATWCAPCRQEMPALARLQQALGSEAFAVAAVNIDTARLDRPRTFLREIAATSLPYYADDTADILQQLKGALPKGTIVGLPTTILVGRDGCEIGTMAGPAQWDSEDAKTLIRAVAD